MRKIESPNRFLACLFAFAAVPVALSLGTARADTAPAPTTAPAAAPVVTQNPTMAPTIDPRSVPQGKVLVTERTPVYLILDQDLKSGSDKPGEEVAYVLQSDLNSSDHVLVAPAGTKAFGRVLQSRRHNYFGKEGKLSISADYILAPDRTKIPLRGSDVGTSGKNNLAGTVVLGVLVSPVSVLINGTDATMKKGRVIEMYIDADTIVSPVMAASRPIDQTTPGVSGVGNSGANQPAITMVYTLKDGTKVTGVESAFDGTTYAIKTDTGLRLIKASDVQSVDKFVPAQVSSAQP